MAPSATVNVHTPDGANQDGGSLDGWGLEICTTTTIGIATYTASTSIAIYPNPNEGLFTVSPKGASNETFTVKIIDNLGRILQQLIVNANVATTVDCKNYSSGIYFVSVEGKNTTQTQKVIITNGK